MSDSLPPTGPPSGPPWGSPPGPPPGMPSGPPPSSPPPPTPPPAGPPAAGAPPAGPPPARPPWGGPPAGPPPEYLEAGGGHRLPPQRPTSSRGGKKKYILGGVGVLALGAVAAGAFAAVSFFSTGAQPAEALPAGTLGYVSIDLDPSGGQKIEALRTLRKFPAFKEQVGLNPEDDLRKKFFDEVQSSEACAGLDYEDDIEPWLGDRMAVAAVDLGEDEPSPVLVVQVTDAGAAEDGLATLRDCATGGGSEDEESSEEMGGWSVDGDWAVIAETTQIAERVAGDAEEGSLADDEDFQRWTGEAGDPGIVTAYAAPEAGKLMAESAAGGLALGQGAEMPCFEPETIEPVEPLDPESSELPEMPELPDYSDESCDDGEAPTEGPMDEATEQLTTMLEEFEGAALTVRFDDGSLEVEAATGTELPGLQSLSGSDQAGVAISTLPEDTAAAWGVGFEEGWFTELLEYAGGFTGDDLDLDELIAQAEAETGLSLPEDVETLAGESATIAVGSDFDLEGLDSGDGGNIPVGAKIKGDAEGIEAVLAKVVDSLAGSEPEAEEVLGSDSNGDFVVVGPDADYRATLLEDGGLGDTGTFEDVVRESDKSGAILFVNFDAGDGWLDSLASGMGDDDELAANLEPLEGLGMSSWQEDGVGHGVFRLTTN